MIKNVLSIAGSDPSGGAGIQADLKAFAANEVYGMAALTALTAQNTQGVTGVELVPPQFVKAQIDAVFADIRVDAVKIGMIATAEIALAVAEALSDHRDISIILDPVMIAKGGAPLLQEDAMETLRTALVPLATVLTPNLPEAARLLQQPEAEGRDAMASQAHALADLGPQIVLVKGGHLEGDESPDVLVGRHRAALVRGPAYHDEEHPRHRLHVVIDDCRPALEGASAKRSSGRGKALRLWRDCCGRPTDSWAWPRASSPFL